LKRLGKIRSPHYRIVVMDARQKRDGRAIEEIGIYHPKNDPSVIEVASERAQYWLGVGAQPTEAVVALFKRSGDWQKFTGEDSPSGIEPQKARPDRLARYNAAIESAPEVETKPKRTAHKKAEPTDEAAADAAGGEVAEKAED
jgi:small subunit ribosomal protein S16